MYKNIFKLLSSSAIGKALGIIVLIFFAKKLSQEEMAVFPIFIMLGGLIGTFFSFGIYPIFLRKLPSLIKEKNLQVEQIIHTALFIIMFFSILGAIGIGYFSTSVSEYFFKGAGNTSIIKLMCLGVISIAFCNFVEHVLWVFGDFGKMSLLRLIEAVSRTLLTVSLYFPYGLDGLVYGLIITQCIKAILSAQYLYGRLKGRYTGCYPVIKLLKESTPFYLESFLMYFRKEGDNWLVSSMLGAASLSVYYIAKMVYEAMLMALSSVDNVFTEKMAGLKAKRVEFFKVADDLHDMLSILAPPFILVVIGFLPVLIVVLIGDKYSESIVPGAILLIALFIQFIRIVPSRIVLIRSNPRVRVYNTLIEGIVLLIGLFFLTPTLHIVGIALARVLSQVSGMMFTIVVLIRDEKWMPALKRMTISTICALPATTFTVFEFYLIEKDLNFIRIVGHIVFWVATYVSLVFLLDRNIILKAKQFFSTQA